STCPGRFLGCQSSRRWLSRWALRLDKQERGKPTTQSASLLKTVGHSRAQKSLFAPSESIMDGYLASKPDLRQTYSGQNHLAARQRVAGNPSCIMQARLLFYTGHPLLHFMTRHETEARDDRFHI